ncbi:MAG: RHS repeat-associated core domain-containing protein [Umezawaea sp.]
MPPRHETPKVERRADLPALDPDAVERTGDRTATSETFDNPDGSRTLRVHSGPSNVRGSDGTWRPIDLGLVEGAGGRWEPRTAGVDTDVAGKADDKSLVRLAFDDRHGLDYGFDGAAAVSGRVDGAKITYPAVLPGVDLTLSATADGVKEDLLLASARTPTSYAFTLKPRGAKPRLADSGAVELVDGDQVVAVIPPGFMQDSASTPQRSEAVRYALTEVDDRTWTLRVDLDPAWLNEPGRVFPVLVDPSTGRFQADSDDTYVQAGQPGRPDNIELATGYVDGRLSRSYLRFGGALNSLRNQYVLGATLELDAVYATTCAPRSISVFEVTQAWDRGMGWPGAAVGQSLASKEFAHGGPSGCAAPAWEGLRLDPDLMTRWTHGTALRNGLALRASNEVDRNGMRFASANTANAPYLDVRYAPEGVSFDVTSVTLPTHIGEGRMVVKATNLGSTAWSTGNGYKFGYIIRQGDTKVRTAAGWTADVALMGTATFDVPIAPLSPGDYQFYLTMFTPQDLDFFVAHEVPYGRFDLKVNNTPPTSNVQQPGSGATVETLTPTLYAEGVDTDDWPGKGLTYKFRVCSDAELTQSCQESGWTGQSWTPAPLTWGRSYFWGVKVNDTLAETPFWVSVKDGVRLVFTTRVHQPEITSHLAGSPGSTEGPGLDAQIGNYSTVVTDASVSTVGPDLTISRTYNSLDPREDTAFGTGWSSRVDMRLTHDSDGSGNEVLTYPSGRQARFGRNPDGSYASPTGQNADLVHDTATGFYTLRDVTGSRWTFDALGRLTVITDPAGLTETLSYDTADHVTTITNDTSKRSLRLTWQGNHVTSVTAPAPETGGQPLVWTYTYVGDKLTKACVPGAAPNCTTYSHQSGSHYRSSVLDDNPRGYWRFGETGGDTFASAAARRDGADAAKQHGVVLGGTGVLAGTTDRAGTFDGGSSYATLPDKLTTATMSLAVELWFKTSSQGTLLSYADQAFPATTAKSTPILYVGTDGLLYGGFARRDTGGDRQVVSATAVNDGQWHHAVLSAAIDTQTLYLDGTSIGSVGGFVDHRQQGALTVGAGSGKDWPATNGGNFHFEGAIDEVAVYTHAVGPHAVRAHHLAGEASDELTEIRLPQDDRRFAALTYDDLNDRVRTLTDHENRVWTVDVPRTQDSTRTAVLRGPSGFGDWGYTFDADNGGRLTSRTHDGKTSRYEYNTAGFLSATVDPNNHRTEQTTDERGNTLSVKTCRAAGSCNTAYATYVKSDAVLDPRRDKLQSTSDARSSGPDDTRYRSTYSYDALGRPTGVVWPIPDGLTAAPAETTTYSTGTEDAVGGGKVPAGLLIRETGRSAQATLRAYRANGDLVEVTTPTGLVLRYTYDLLGRQTSASQVTSGNAVLSTTAYAYTPRSQLAKVTGPAVVNAVTGIAHTPVTAYEYDGNGNTTATTVSDLTPQDKGGDQARRTTFGYDGSDRLVLTTFADNGRESRSYPDSGLTLAVTDVNGTTWSTRYDELGRELGSTASGAGVNPENPSATSMTLEVNAYDPAGRLATTTDAMGRLTTYTYYDDDLPATTRRTVGNGDGTTRDVLLDQRSYDPSGQLVEQVAAGGRKTVNTYDPAGFVTTSTFDPGGLARTTTAKYDADGNTTRIERRGAADPNRVEVSTYAYDVANLPVREDAHLDGTTALSSSTRRDERGLVRESVDRRGLTTSFDHDAAGAVVLTVHPPTDAWVAGTASPGFKRTEVLGYNTFGEVTHARDGSGGVSTTEYDVRGRVVAGTLPDYTPPGGRPVKATTRTEYDRLGNPVKTTDPLDRITTSTYDPYGRVLTTTLPQVGELPSVLGFRYDKLGEQVPATDPSGAETRATYDDLGRPTTRTVVDRSSGALAYFTTTTDYDDAGNTRTVRTPQGATTTATYNTAGEPLSTKDATNRVTTFGYDIAGRSVSATGPSGITTTTGHDLLGRSVRTAQVVAGQEKRVATTVYDAVDNVSSTRSPEGRTVGYAHDELNRLVRQVEKVDDTRSITTLTGYDKLGNRSRFVDGNGRATTYTYNPWGLPESIVEPGGSTWTTSYNAAGEAVRVSKPGGVSTTAEFDAQGRPTVERGTGAEGVTADRTFGYDRSGRLNRVGGPRGDSTYRYDDRGNLLEARGAAGDSTYTYDGDGTVASRTDATGTATFGYDTTGRLTAVVDPLSGRTADYGYDAAGRLSQVADRSYAKSTARRLAYDDLGRLKSDQVQQFVDAGVPPRVLVGDEYGYDLDDKRTARTSTSTVGSTTNGYGYDGAGRLTSWTAGTKTTAYGWDDAGNRTSVGDKASTYDEHNRLLSGDGATYTYTPRGTLASTTRDGVETRTKFDAFDRMTTNGVGNYGYDGLDRVTDRNGVAFQYAGMSNEAVTDGRRLVSRLPDGTAFSDRATGATSARMLYADNHGDVTGRYLGNSVDGQRTFDPFGKVTAANGDTSTIGYQGDWTDQDTGAVNMSARWYQPGTGTFTSRDDWTLNPTPSSATNRYAYGNSDPITNSDPSGHDAVDNVCNAGGGKNNPVKFLAKVGAFFGTFFNQMICNAPRTAGVCVATRLDDHGRPCPNNKYIWNGGNEEPIPVGNCKYFTGGCASRDAVRPTTPGKHTPANKPGVHKPVVRKPIPPPPPPWVVNIYKPLPKPPLGRDIIPVAPTYNATSPFTVITDLGEALVGAATAVTSAVGTAGTATATAVSTGIQAVVNSIGIALPFVFQQEDDDDDDFCADMGMEENVPRYGPMKPIKYPGGYVGRPKDGATRATGADVCLEGINHGPRNTPLEPAGINEDANLRKGHLVAHMFHGSNARDNMVPLYDKVNSPDMLAIENTVKRAVKGRERVYYQVVPHFTGPDKNGTENPVPDFVHIYAVGSDGFHCDVVINNIKGGNAQRPVC